jgi:hypothetical protein
MSGAIACDGRQRASGVKVCCRRVAGYDLLQSFRVAAPGERRMGLGFNEINFF